MENTLGNRDKSSKDEVPAVSRAFDILEFLHSRNRAVALNEIAEQLRIPRASAFRIVRTLLKRGYVARSSNASMYLLGAKFLALGSRSGYLSGLSEIANPFMYQLAERSGQSVQLGVLFEYQVMYIDQIRVSNALTLAVPTFEPYAVNLSAGGKVLVAYLEGDSRADFLRNTKLEKNTPKSVVDKSVFTELLDQVRRDGYALDDGEFAEGIRCVAAPIFDRDGNNIASVGVTGHVLEMNDKRLPQIVELAVTTANRISEAYGTKYVVVSRSSVKE